MIRGTSHQQDSRFKDKAQKMLLQSKWPDKYDVKIDLTKIDFQALKTWIQKRTTQLLGYEDDIVSGTVVSLLQQSLTKSEKPNAKKIHIAMSGFLTTHTLTFISQLWNWLDQAQKSKSGISKRLIDQKKYEQNEKRHKLKQINQRKDKMKNYKFDIIKNQIGRQREPSAEAKRKERQNQYDPNQDKDKKKKKNKGRSQSRDNKKKRKRSYDSQEQFQNRQKSAKKSKKVKRRRSFSRSNSSQSKNIKKLSRSREKNKKAQRKFSSPSRSNSIQRKRDKTKGDEPKHKNRQRKRQRRQSESRSQSSQVISSSQNQN